MSKTIPLMFVILILSALGTMAAVIRTPLEAQTVTMLPDSTHEVLVPSMVTTNDLALLYFHRSSVLLSDLVAIIDQATDSADMDKISRDYIVGFPTHRALKPVVRVLVTIKTKKMKSRRGTMSSKANLSSTSAARLSCKGPPIHDVAITDLVSDDTLAMPLYVFTKMPNPLSAQVSLFVKTVTKAIPSAVGMVYSFRNMTLCNTGNCTHTLRVRVSTLREPSAVCPSTVIVKDRVYHLYEAGPTTDTTVFFDEPTTHWSFGFITAGRTDIVGRPAMKLDNNGLIKETQLGEVVTMPVVTWHVLPYQQGNRTWSLGNEWLGFGGIAITPALGVGGGVGWEPLRGMALDAGVTWLHYDTMRKGDKLGAAPSKLSDPFEPTWGRVFFIGLELALTP